jgi:hypothetical protein
LGIFGVSVSVVFVVLCLSSSRGSILLLFRSTSCISRASSLAATVYVRVFVSKTKRELFISRSMASQRQQQQSRKNTRANWWIVWLILLYADIPSFDHFRLMNWCDDGLGGAVNVLLCVCTLPLWYSQTGYCIVFFFFYSVPTSLEVWLFFYRFSFGRDSILAWCRHQ